MKCDTICSALCFTIVWFAKVFYNTFALANDRVAARMTMTYWNSFNHCRRGPLCLDGFLCSGSLRERRRLPWYTSSASSCANAVSFVFSKGCNSALPPSASAPFSENPQMRNAYNFICLNSAGARTCCINNRLWSGSQELGEVTEWTGTVLSSRCAVFEPSI